MSNKILTCQRIAREALPMLVNNLVVPELFHTCLLYTSDAADD
mgnify:CR=1 FL=1